VVCSSGIGFDPMLDGERLTFGFEGIWQGTAVLYDRRTTSLWMHTTGECFAGELAGRALAPLESGRHTTWGAWKQDHPTTDVMAPDANFEKSYFRRDHAKSGAAFLPPDFPSTIQDRDPRLPLEALLLGVRAGGAARAYPYTRLAKGTGVVEESLGGVPVTVWYDAGQRSAAVFDARLDGKTLHFERVVPPTGPARFRDRESASLWNLDGVAVSGPSQGRRLARPVSLLTEWYGWFAHHPATTIWGD
jgi:hypothetical protein